MARLDLDPDAIAGMTRAFLRKGGQIARVPAGASIEYPATLPAGAQRDRAVALHARELKHGKLRSPETRARLREMFLRQAPRAEIFGYLFGATSVPETESRFWQVIYQCRRFGIEIPDYLLETRCAAQADLGVTNTPCRRTRKQRPLTASELQALDWLSMGSPIAEVLRVHQLEHKNLLSLIEHRFGDLAALHRLRTWKALCLKLDIAPDEIAICLVCKGKRGSMLGRAGGRCAICAGEVMRREVGP